MNLAGIGKMTSNAPRLRRAYYDCRFGQLHLYQAMPAGGGFDEAPALLCIGAGGRFFQSLLALLGRDRSVYALDPPGCGQSDPLDAPPGVTESAAAVGDLLDSLYLRSADVLAHREGVAIALALRQQRPAAIRCLALSGASDAQRAQSREIPGPLLLIDLADGIEQAEPGLRTFLGSAARS